MSNEIIVNVAYIVFGIAGAKHPVSIEEYQAINKWFIDKNPEIGAYKLGVDNSIITVLDFKAKEQGVTNDN